jgi:hypothetical protein
MTRTVNHTRNTLSVLDKQKARPEDVQFESAAYEYASKRQGGGQRRFYGEACLPPSCSMPLTTPNTVLTPLDANSSLRTFAAS